jgi:hypothetical protein
VRTAAEAQAEHEAGDTEATWRWAVRQMVLAKHERALTTATTAQEIRGIAKNIEAVRDPRWRP